MKRMTAALAALLCACGSPPSSDEARARERFLRELAAREGLPEAGGLMASADLVFEDGFSLPELTDPSPPGGWRERRVPNASVRAVPVRWMAAQAHLRVRGRGAHRLILRGRVHADVMATRPRLTIAFDGVEVWSGLTGVDGGFDLDLPIPADWLDGWSDVYVRLSSVHEPWRTLRDLRIARLEHAAWTPQP